VKPASHNRFYLSPYYPVFGSRLVMIGDPCRDENVRNGFLAGPFGDFAGSPLAHGSHLAHAWLTPPVGGGLDTLAVAGAGVR